MAIPFDYYEFLRLELGDDFGMIPLGGLNLDDVSAFDEDNNASDFEEGASDEDAALSGLSSEDTDSTASEDEEYTSDEDGYSSDSSEEEEEEANAELDNRYYALYFANQITLTELLEIVSDPKEAIAYIQSLTSENH